MQETIEGKLGRYKAKAEQCQRSIMRLEAEESQLQVEEKELWENLAEYSITDEAQLEQRIAELEAEKAVAEKELDGLLEQLSQYFPD